ncbi:hypothetical protein K449DRAFT_470181 [Hypoxylon sp. EC38]|nr:hypothetical protein K449DRAFT_470181 [Hypoxylon sp. EC38]
MRFSLFFIVGFTAGIGAATPVNLYESNTIEHLPREVIEGRCYAGARSGSGNGICYENYEARSGWTGNCDPAPYACTSNGNYCNLSTVPGGVVMCT